MMDKAAVRCTLDGTTYRGACCVCHQPFNVSAFSSGRVSQKHSDYVGNHCPSGHLTIYYVPPLEELVTPPQRRAADAKLFRPQDTAAFVTATVFSLLAILPDTFLYPDGGAPVLSWAFISALLWFGLTLRFIDWYWFERHGR